MKSSSLLRSILGSTAVIALLLAFPAKADWDLGDPYKMHYPQLPDPNGWDVLFTEPKVLADDWRCTETGPVSDVHLWFSSQHDRPFNIHNVHLSIHADIPAGTGGLPYSSPGQLLWERDFDPALFTVRNWHETGHQGWYDPNTGFYTPYDHFGIWQLNIQDIIDPWFQQQGTIYWLDVTVVSDVPLGWKTTSDHWNDDAVWSDFPGTYWHELRDPMTHESLDMAFVITPEPSSFALAGFGLAALLALRKRR